jgi:hypothetical protein
MIKTLPLKDTLIYYLNTKVDKVNNNDITSIKDDAVHLASDRT